MPKSAPAAGLLLALAFPLVQGCDKQIRESDIVNIHASEVQRLVGDARTDRARLLLLDPRAPDEFRRGHLPGARNLLLSDLTDARGMDATLASHRQIVVYGNDPESPPGRAMTKRLLALGYSDVKFFAGGLAEWRKLGLPVEPAPDSAP